MTRDFVVSLLFLAAWIGWPWIEESVYVGVYLIWGEE